MMSNTPTTLSIDQTEWRVLFASNIARVSEFVNGNAALTEEALVAMLGHLDRAKLLATAWFKASPAVQAAPPVVEPTVERPLVPANANGAEKPKKKGGWPLGKKRVRANPGNAQVVQ